MRIWLFIFAVLGLCTPASAAILVVDAGGGGDHTTIQACIDVAVAGDTCEVVAGTYSETVTFGTSGTAGNPIILKGQSSIKPVVTGAIIISEEDYLTIQNMELRDWIRCSPFDPTPCNFIQILDNYFDMTSSNNPAIQLWADDVLISGNEFDNLSADMVRQHGDRWTVRNNTVVGESAGAVHMDFWQSFCSAGVAASFVLIENNTYVNISGSDAHFALINTTASCSDPPTNHIYRYNKVDNIGSKAIYIDNNNQAAGAGDNVIYNNTFVRLIEGLFTSGDRFCCPVEASENSSGFNNLFWDAMHHVNAEGFRDGTGWESDNNLYYDPAETMTFAAPASGEANSVKNQDPLLNLTHYTIPENSPAKDAGKALTTVAVADTGSGTSLIVEKAEFFQPGWGGADADTIAVGTTSNTVQISSIDYGTNTITLASGISRSDGESVWLYADSDGTQVLYGSAPDIGAHELMTASTQPPTVHYNDYKNTTAVTDVTSLTISNVVATGDNRGLAVCVMESATTAGVSVSSVTFNTSENATFVAEAVHNELNLEFWYLSNPTATTADVVITLSGAGGVTALMGTAIALSNVKQAQPTLSNNAKCDSCTNETVDITTTAANTLLLVCARHNSGQIDFSWGAGQTELSDFREPGGGDERMGTSWELKVISGLETLEATASGPFEVGTIPMVVIGVEPVAAVTTRRRVRANVFR